MKFEFFLSFLVVALPFAFGSPEGSSSTSNSCVKLGNSSSVCSPWLGDKVFIDTKKLAKLYGIKASKTGSQFGVKEWDSLVIAMTSGGKNQAKYWKKWSACTGYKGEHLQYYQSFICLTDIFVHSAHCNKQDQELTPICPEVCENYGSAVKKMISNEDVCPTDDIFDELDYDTIKKIKKRRKIATKALEICKKVSAKSNFNKKEQCVTGIKRDQDSCGFSGNQTVATKYCEKNPKATCCYSLAPNSTSTESQTYQDSMIGAFQRLTMMWGATAVNSASTPKKPFTQSIAFYVIIGVVALMLISVLSYVIIRSRRAKANAAGFVMLKDGAGVPLVDSTSGHAGQLRCIVKYDYTPNLSDEIELKVGDIIIFESLSDDGWGDAKNETTGQFGKACTRFCEKM